MLTHSNTYSEQVLAEAVLDQSGKGWKAAEVRGATLYHHRNEIETNGY